jgi:hypothetical protein
MSADWIAAVSALVVTAVASFVPTDRMSDRQARCWATAQWRSYRAKLLLLQLVATALFGLAAHQIGWSPDPAADAFEAAVHGVGWSIAAVALLRAEFPGGPKPASPGFSILRSISQELSARLTDHIAEAVRNELPQTIEKLKEYAFACKSEAHRPREDGSLTADSKGLSANIEILSETNNVDDLRALIVDLVIKHKLCKCWPNG